MLALTLIICGPPAASAGNTSGSPIDTSGGETDISGGETDASGEEAAPFDVLSVLVPADIDFVIDPLEIARRGQVYSDVRAIENHGEYDVLFSVTDVSVIFANDTDFVPAAYPFESSFRDTEKRIFLELNLGGNTLAITDGAARSPSAPVMISSAGNAGSLCPVSVTGSVNPYSETEWQDGDVKIRIVYQIEAVADREAETDESEGLDEDSTPAPEEDQELPGGGDGVQTGPENENGDEDESKPAEGGIPPGGEEETAAEDTLTAEPPPDEAAGEDESKEVTSIENT